MRRILRRAVRYGRSLGFHEPFFFKLVDVVAKTMGDVFPEVRAKQQTIKETIRREEEAFNKTLDKGIELFEEAVRLNDTSGLPSAQTAIRSICRVYASKVGLTTQMSNMDAHSFELMNGGSSKTIVG